MSAQRAEHEAVEEEVRRRFPGAALQRVELLRHGDEPAIEPGETGVRLVIDGGEGALDAFQREHGAELKKLLEGLRRIVPGAAHLELSGGGQMLFLRHLEHGPGARGAELTPVMARLGPVDLETL